LSGLIYKIAKYIPISAMGGYLVAIGAVLVLPFNAMDAFAAGNPIVVALTMGATVATNPFYGLLMGLIAKIVMGWLGVL
jgi:AGZA family xanthine/uracil permease-like MFS transporter